MNIKYTPVNISARVKNEGDLIDVMKDIAVMVDCVDEDSKISVFYQLHYKFPEENSYTEETPFVEFDDISEEHVKDFVQNLMDNSPHMKEWAEQRIQEIIDEPLKKPFVFQRSISQTFDENVILENGPTIETETSLENLIGDIKE